MLGRLIPNLQCSGRPPTRNSGTCSSVIERSLSALVRGGLVPGRPAAHLQYLIAVGTLEEILR